MADRPQRRLHRPPPGLAGLRAASSPQTDRLKLQHQVERTVGAEYLALRSRRAKGWRPEPVPTTPLQTPSLQLRAGPGARPTASLDAEGGARGTPAGSLGGGAGGGPGSSLLSPERLLSQPACGATGSPGSAEQASGQRGAGASRVLSRHISQHAAMDGSTLPSGFAVFTTFPELLFIFELVFGGLVWMLITSSQLPNPLLQGWVTFVSVFCFIGTGVLLFLYLTGAHGGETSWVSLESAYHTVAVLLYSIASILEILATIYMQDGFTYEHYLENISAVVFSCITSLLYMAHVVFV
ncbi:uncharacterized protein LOC124239623 [Equus quagga]|uniref:uncharacterized protein LOC124239623 n=1 Tax=Equus quagga TaxID=89248 RepID=UPI001EE1CC60|nr:uncharacterized protein LOC124239623 [Equus quagga]